MPGQGEGTCSDEWGEGQEPLDTMIGRSCGATQWGNSNEEEYVVGVNVEGVSVLKEDGISEDNSLLLETEIEVERMDFETSTQNPELASVAMESVDDEGEASDTATNRVTLGDALGGFADPSSQHPAGLLSRLTVPRNHLCSHHSLYFIRIHGPFEGGFVRARAGAPDL